MSVTAPRRVCHLSKRAGVFAEPSSGMRFFSEDDCCLIWDYFGSVTVSACKNPTILVYAFDTDRGFGVFF